MTTIHSHPHLPLHNTAASYAGWNVHHPRWHLTSQLKKAFPHLSRQISAEARRAPHLIHGTPLRPAARKRAPFTRKEFNAGRTR